MGEKETAFSPCFPVFLSSAEHARTINRLQVRCDSTEISIATEDCGRSWPNATQVASGCVGARAAASSRICQFTFALLWWHGSRAA